MGERHPAHSHILIGELARRRGASRVGEQIAVSEHDALRLAGRAGGELNEGQIVRRRPMKLAGPRDVGDGLHQKTARLQILEYAGFTHLGGEGLQPLQILRVGVQQRLAQRARAGELSSHPQQLVAVLVADPDRQRHGHYTAANGRPIAIEELLVAAQEDDHLVAALRTHGLQVVQNAQCPRVHIAVRHAPLGVLTFDVGDGAIDGAIALQDVDQGGIAGQSACVVHLSFTVIMRLDRGRKLICASSSMGSLPARLSRKRRDMACTCTSISNIAMFSPMQCRGPTANGM